MMFLTHLSFSLFLGLLITKYAGVLIDKYFFLAFILFGSVLPDIDCADSLIGRKFKLLSLFFKHRGFFHSIISMIILAIIVFLITNKAYYSLAIIIGFLSHLFLDSLTRAGIAPFWPSKLRVRGIFKTSRLFDWILFGIFILCCITYFLY